MCHIKETHSKQLTDTAHFSHKNITKLTITHTDKILIAIAEWAKTIKAVGSENRADKMKQLHQLTERAITMNTTVSDKMLRQPAGQAQETVLPTTVSEKPW